MYNLKKFEKELFTSVPGFSTGVDVEYVGNIDTAIQNWKRILTDSNKLNVVYEKRMYIKPSAKRRKVILDAKYRNKKKYDSTDEFI